MSSKANKKTAPLSREFLKGLWTKISVDDWFSVACEFKPDGKWKKSGGTIRGSCLEHQESTPSMDILIEKGFVYCHGCGYREWNPLDFYRKLSGYTTLNVIGDLSQRFNIKFPGKTAEKLQMAKEHNEMKMAFFRACNNEFREQLIKTEPYAEAAINWLRTRSLDFSTSQLWPIGIVPPVAKLKSFLETSRISQFYQPILAHVYLANALHTIGHIAMFPFSSPSTISYIKTREPFSKNFRLISDEFVDTYEGVFCLNTFVHLLGNLQDNPVYVFEGEFDALSILSHSRAAGHDDLCVISTGGNHEVNLQFLADFGISNLHIVPDNDGGGIGWAQHILKSSADLIKKVMVWPFDAPSRIDPEEAVGKFGFEVFWKMVQDNLAAKSDWAYEILAPRLADTDDLTQINQITNISKCLFDADRVALHQRIEKELGIKTDLIPAALLDDLDESSIASFVIKIAHDLQRRFSPLYYEDTNGARSHIMYDPATRSLVNLPVGKQSDRCRLELQTAISMTLQEYCKKIGEPLEVESKFTKNGDLYPKPFEAATKLRNLCLQQAVEIVNMNTAPRGAIKELTSGMHLIDDVTYISNGKTLIKGEITDGEIIFSDVETPKLTAREGQLLFIPGTAPWSEFIHTPGDLYEGKGFDAKEVFETIVDLLNGWQLEEKENGLSQKILAADVLYTPIASAFPTMTALRLKGPSHSGKSALMSFMYRSRDPDGYYLCEAANYIDSYSWAGIRGLINGSTLRLCLDEFEQSNRPGLTKQSEAVNSILNNIRNTSKGAVVMMGNSDMSSHAFSLRCPVFVAGIHSMNEYRDLSRFVPIETMRIDNFYSPISKIRAKFNPEQMRDLRKKITLCLFHRIPEIRETCKTIIHELSKFGLMDRLIELLAPAACIMKIVGVPDYLEVIEKFARLKTIQIANMVDDDDATPLLKSILWTPFPAMMVSTNYPKSIIKLEEVLQDPTAFDLPTIGVHLLDDKHLLIRWVELSNTVLANSKNFKFRTPQRLRSTVANSKYDISKTSLPSPLQTKVNDLLRSGANEYDYSIIDLQVLGMIIPNLHASMTAPVQLISESDCLHKFGDI